MPCDFTPESVSNGKRWWREQTQFSEPCRRPNWKNQSRCIWHTLQTEKPTNEIQKAIKREKGSEIECAYLEKSDLSGIDFTGIDFRNANFGGVDFQNSDFGSADYSGSLFSKADLSNKDLYNSVFKNCNFEDTDISGSDLKLVDFTDSELHRANLEHVKCSQTNFSDTDLEEAILSNSLLKTARFDNAKILDTSLGDVSVNKETFDDKCIYEKDEQWEKAANVYRTLTTIYRENSISNSAHMYYFRHKQCKRRSYKQKSGISSCKEIRNTDAWFRAEVARFLTGYGDRPGRVVAAWGLITAVWTLIYGAIRGIERNGYILDPINNFADYVYFSVSTFTSLGGNNLQPANSLSKAVAATEALFGAVMIALLVYVLSRRITW